MTPLKSFSLKYHNTFGFDVDADYFVKTHNESELVEALRWAKSNDVPVFPIGGGSNLLLTQPLQALALQQKNAEIRLEKETQDVVILHASAAVLWHDLVLYCVANEYYGIENLSLIPGCVGAAPMQNIGAYGVELADVLVSVDVIEISSARRSRLSCDECRLSYRDSVFKNEYKGRYVITGITIQLQKNRQFTLTYAALKNAIDALDKDSLSLKVISDTVCKIRNSKLPVPEELGNAGSFFKNPCVLQTQLEQAKKNWPDIPFHKQADGSYKIPAAWMVEKSGWKGYRHKNIGVHYLQAIVLINYGQGTGQEILELADLIVDDVLRKFGVRLEIEPVTV